MKRRVLSLLLTLALLCGIGSVTVSANSMSGDAFAVEGGNIYIENGCVVGCDGMVTAADIPAEFGGVAVTSVDYAAFSNCVFLTRVTLPKSIESVDASSFMLCPSLSGVWVDEDNAYFCSDENGVLFNKDKTTLEYSPAAFAGVYHIPDSVTCIKRDAFNSCTGLTGVVIPDSVTEIGYFAFQACTDLASVVLPAGITQIQTGTFDFCTHLKDITIPDGVESIGLRAFSGSGLKSITIPDSMTAIGDEAFENSDLTSISLGRGLTSIGDEAFHGTPYYTDSENWTDGLLYIDDYLIGAALDYEGTCDIASGIRVIADSVFFGRGLTDVWIPDSVVAIGYGAFSNCSSLTQAVLPSGLTSLRVGVFLGCSSLTQVVLPSGLTSIGAYAFEDCTSLTSVIVPASVTKIDYYAFKNCSSLTGVYFLGDAPELGNHAFQQQISSFEYENIPGLTLYYLEGKANWTTPMWNGYPTDTWTHEHDYTYADRFTPPTCTEQGYTRHYCVCGDSYTDTEIPALGHSYENGVCIFCGEPDPNGEPEPWTNPFVDVQAGKWYFDGVRFACRSGLFSGITKTEFRPNQPMTRGMLVTVLWRLDGKPDASGYPNPFSDVPSGKYFTSAVRWAAGNGVVNGISAGKFVPDGNITREQMAAILYRYAGMKGYDTAARTDLNTYPDDGKASNYAKTPLSWANAEGLITGDKQNGVVVLNPSGNATRAQVAVIFMRYAENIVDR